MIYFDRIEVVNFLIQSAGEFFPCDPVRPAIQSGGYSPASARKKLAGKSCSFGAEQYCKHCVLACSVPCGALYFLGFKPALPDTLLFFSCTYLFFATGCFTDS